MPKFRSKFVFIPVGDRYLQNKVECKVCGKGYLTLTQNGLDLFYCEYCKTDFFYEAEEYKRLDKDI